VRLKERRRASVAETPNGPFEPMGMGKLYDPIYLDLRPMDFIISVQRLMIAFARFVSGLIVSRPLIFSSIDLMCLLSLGRSPL